MLDLPPILLSYSPCGEDFVSQVYTSFEDVARRISMAIPAFKQENGVFTVLPRRPKGVVPELISVTEESVKDWETRKTISQMAIGDYWELMNVADLLFHWKKDIETTPILKFSTTHFSNIEFSDPMHAITFLFDMEGRWDDWLKQIGRWAPKHDKGHQAALDQMYKDLHA